MAGPNSKDVNGICTPFGDTAICPIPSAESSVGADVKGGVDIPEGQKQTTPGETGSWVSTVTVPGEIKGGPGTKRPDIAGS